MTFSSDRRQYERYLLPSMYTVVAVRELECDAFELSGHAYDISRGGMRFELDQPIAPGTRIALRIELPGGVTTDWSAPRAVFAFANVVWLEQDDLDSTGPVRMACVFTNFCRPGHEEALMRRLRSGRFAKAA
jgi:c-di-GMP-binding flagellar brake protein YcgR